MFIYLVEFLCVPFWKLSLLLIYAIKPKAKSTKMKASCQCLLLIAVLPLIFSCASTKSITNFNDLTDSTIAFNVQSLEPVLQKNDILNISVASLNPEANQPFNLYTVVNTQGAAVSGTVSQSSGYLVDQDGYIQFPMLGNIKAAGYTKKQLKETITKGLIQRKLLYEPIVSIRYLNYRVTVLGEVARPNVFNIPGEKVTLLEALGLAGDLTPYARRDNVLIIHEDENGKRETIRMNLNKEDLFTSPYYYLKSNDIVYVSPNKSQAVGTSTTKQWLPAVLAGMSFLAIVIDRLTR